MERIFGLLCDFDREKAEKDLAESQKFYDEMQKETKKLIPRSKVLKIFTIIFFCGTLLSLIMEVLHQNIWVSWETDLLLTAFAVAGIGFFVFACPHSILEQTIWENEHTTMRDVCRFADYYIYLEKSGSTIDDIIVHIKDDRAVATVYYTEKSEEYGAILKAYAYDRVEIVPSSDIMECILNFNEAKYYIPVKG